MRGLCVLIYITTIVYLLTGCTAGDIYLRSYNRGYADGLDHAINYLDTGLSKEQVKTELQRVRKIK